MFVHGSMCQRLPITPLEVGTFCPCCCGSCHILSFWTTFLRRPMRKKNLLTHTHRFFPNVGKIMKKCTGFACHYLGGSSYAGGSRMAPDLIWEVGNKLSEIHLGSSSPFKESFWKDMSDKIWKKNSKVHTLHQKINGTLPTDPQVSYQIY